jgi:hypothetical protein
MGTTVAARRRMRRVTLMVALLVFAGGCRLTAATPAEVQTTSAEPPIGPPAMCRLTTTETVGCDSREVEALLEPVRVRLEACRGSSSGKLTIRVRSAGGKLTLDPVPGSSLDPRQRQCVLDALTQVYTTENTTLWSVAPGVPPTNFTSLLTVSWD